MTSVSVTDDGSNEAKVLLVDPRSQNGQQSSNLLYCDTRNYGQCQIYDVNDLSLKDDGITDSDNYAYLGSSTSIVALFNNAGFMDTGDRQVLYVAQEKTIATGNTPVLSSRDLIEEGGSFKIELVSETLFDDYGEYDIFRETDIDDSLHSEYKIKYLYGFAYGGFVFYVTVQKSNLGNFPFTTHLGRICEHDDNYNSFAEIELQCSDSGQANDEDRYAKLEFLRQLCSISYLILR